MKNSIAIVLTSGFMTTFIVGGHIYPVYAQSEYTHPDVDPSVHCSPGYFYNYQTDNCELPRNNQQQPQYNQQLPGYYNQQQPQYNQQPPGY